MIAIAMSQDKRSATGLSIRELMDRAIALGASDIHLTPGRPPMFRIDGDLLPLPDKPSLSAADTMALAKEINTDGQWEKFLETRELDTSLSRHGVGRFRVNVHWQRGSVALALRAIPSRIPSFKQLGLPEILREVAMMHQGLFLVSGPTGSGKTTTLAWMINYINEHQSSHIVTIEDPIEYLHRHKKSLVTQREMHHDTLSFSEALRHVLRQDPNVILIGEMRDLETIQAALTLAETGHLVLATLHTGDATQALTRIVDVYPPYQQTQVRTQLSFVLIGILVQQLVRRQSGSGRVLAHESLVVTPAIRHLIRTSEIQQIYSAIQTGSTQGMSTLNASLLELCCTGQISRDEAIQKTTRTKEFIELLDRADQQKAMESYGQTREKKRTRG